MAPIVQWLWVQSQSFVDVTHAFMYHSVLTFEAGVDFFFKAKFWGSFFSGYCSSIDLLYFVKKVFNRYPFISVSVSFVADSLVFQQIFIHFFFELGPKFKPPLRLQPINEFIRCFHDFFSRFFFLSLSSWERKQNYYSS